MKRLATLTAAAAFAVAFGFAGTAIAGSVIDFDGLGDGVVVTDQFKADGAEFSSSPGPAKTLDDAPEATSSPNILVGDPTPFGGLFKGPIFMDIVDAVGDPATTNAVCFFLISVGHNEVTVLAKDVVPSVVDSEVVRNLGGPQNGFANQDFVFLSGAGIARVDMVTTITTFVDGWGIDDVVVDCSIIDEADIVKATVLHPLDIADTIHTGDKDTVFFGLDTQQFKAFTITITNNSGVDGGLGALTFTDATGAEWDLDPSQDAQGDGGDLDGVEVTANSADCTASGAEHTDKGKSGKNKNHPDKITISAAGLDDGESCTITVWVKTDENFAHGPKSQSPDFKPTSCPVPLNDGVKVFDASNMNLVLEDDDELIFSNLVGNTCVIP